MNSKKYILFKFFSIFIFLLNFFHCDVFSSFNFIPNKLEICNYRAFSYKKIKKNDTENFSNKDDLSNKTVNLYYKEDINNYILEKDNLELLLKKILNFFSENKNTCNKYDFSYELIFKLYEFKDFIFSIDNYYSVFNLSSCEACFYKFFESNNALFINCDNYYNEEINEIGSCCNFEKGSKAFYDKLFKIFYNKKNEFLTNNERMIVNQMKNKFEYCLQCKKDVYKKCAILNYIKTLFFKNCGYIEKSTYQHGFMHLDKFIYFLEFYFQFIDLNKKNTIFLNDSFEKLELTKIFYYFFYNALKKTLKLDQRNINEEIVFIKEKIKNFLTNLIFKFNLQNGLNYYLESDIKKFLYNDQSNYNIFLQNLLSKYNELKKNDAIFIFKNEIVDFINFERWRAFFQNYHNKKSDLFYKSIKTKLSKSLYINNSNNN